MCLILGLSAFFWRRLGKLAQWSGCWFTALSGAPAVRVQQCPQETAGARFVSVSSRHGAHRPLSRSDKMAFGRHKLLGFPDEHWTQSEAFPGETGFFLVYQFTRWYLFSSICDEFSLCLNLDLILMYLYLQINKILPLWYRVEFFVECTYLSANLRSGQCPPGIQLTRRSGPCSSQGGAVPARLCTFSKGEHWHLRQHFPKPQIDHTLEILSRSGMKRLRHECILALQVCKSG